MKDFTVRVLAVLSFVALLGILGHADYADKMADASRTDQIRQAVVHANLIQDAREGSCTREERPRFAAVGSGQ